MTEDPFNYAKMLTIFLKMEEFYVKYYLGGMQTYYQSIHLKKGRNKTAQFVWTMVSLYGLKHSS